MQVEALRDKLSSLQSDFKATTLRNNELQQQLLGAKRSHSTREKELLDENEQLSAQVSNLEYILLEHWCSVYATLLLLSNCSNESTDGADTSVQQTISAVCDDSI